MDTDKFGPFVNIVAIGTALVAVFGLFLARMVGNSKQLAWLAGSETPPIIIAIGPRMAAIALMVATYVLINASNFILFVLLAIAIGGLGFWAATRFDHLRKLHVVDIPVVAKNGRRAVDKRGNPISRSVVIGSESDMLPEAKAALTKARKAKGGLSLVQFMSGYGAEGEVNNPQAIWDRALLAKISSRVATLLMYIILAAVLVLFIGATAVDVAQPTPPTPTPDPGALRPSHLTTLLELL